MTSSSTTLPHHPLPADLKVIIEEFNELEEEIRHTHGLLEEMQRRKLVSPLFRPEAEEQREAHDIAVHTEHLTQLFKKADRKLAELELVGQSHQNSPPTEKLYHNMRLAYSAKIHTLANRFKQSQSKFVSVSAKKKPNVTTTTNPAATTTSASGHRFSHTTTFKPNVVEELERAEAMDKYMEKGLTEDQAMSLMANEEQMKDRDVEIRQLYNSLVQLHEVFQDVNTLVMEQGTVLDQIDYNMTKSKENVVKATEELLTTQKNQNAGRFKLCVLFLVMLIFGFLVAILMKSVV
eukprot:PhF_6_TR31174/c0_g1_i1/m.45700/K08489/STX16; syntaxin 16